MVKSFLQWPRRILCLGLSALLLNGWSVSALAGELNMPRGVTDISNEIYELHMIIFYVCVVIGILVFGAMIISIIKHRKSVHPVPATFTHSTTAEIAWTVVPIVILIVMAYPAAKLLIKLEDNRNADVTVEVTGYQWNWHYNYPGQGVDFFSKLSMDSMEARRKNSGIDIMNMPTYLLDVDRPMVVPVNKKVVIKLTANDVIHAWWVPELGGKKDAVPGFVNTMWFQANEIGTYRGQCSELCGRDHGFMPIVVEVVSDADYARWLADNGRADAVASTQSSNPSSTSTNEVGSIVETAPEVVTQQVVSQVESGEAASTVVAESVAAAATEATGMEALMAQGEKVYKVHCVACHQAEGQGLPPVFPALSGSAIVKGPIEKHIGNVVNGVSGTTMVAFGAQLSDEEIAAVVTYERNALGNSVGDSASPADVAALRSK